MSVISRLDSGGGVLRPLIVGFATYGLGDFFLFGLSYFALIPILTRNLLPEEYGVVATLASVSILLVSVFQFGFPSAAFRFYFVHAAGEERRAYFGSIWLFSLTVSALLSALALSVGQPIWDSLIRNAPFSMYAGYVIGGAFFQVVIVFRSVLLRAQDRPRLYVILDVAQFVCFVGLVTYHVVVLHEGAVGQVRAAFFTYALFALISAFIVACNVHLRFKWSYVRESLRFALPVLLTYLVGFFFLRANVLILQYLVVGSIVGIYAFGQQLSNIIVMLSAAFEKAWQPLLYRQSIANGRILMARFLSAFVPAYVGMALVLGLFAPEFIRILSPSVYDKAWSVVAISGFGAAFIAISSFTNGAIYYMKRSDVTMWIQAAGAVVNVALIVILAPIWGMIGAAWASVISGLSILLLNIWSVQRLFTVPMNYGRMLGAASLGVAILVTMTALNDGLQLSMIGTLLLKAGAMFLYVGLSWALGIFPPKDDPGFARRIYGLVRSAQR